MWQINDETQDLVCATTPDLVAAPARPLMIAELGRVLQNALACQYLSSPHTQALASMPLCVEAVQDFSSLYSNISHIFEFLHAGSDSASDIPPTFDSPNQTLDWMRRVESTAGQLQTWLDESANYQVKFAMSHVVYCRIPFWDWLLQVLPLMRNNARQQINQAMVMIEPQIKSLESTTAATTSSLDHFRDIDIDFSQYPNFPDLLEWIGHQMKNRPH